ncbi:bifunctional nuclease family protein [Candidatus Bathyarchaeota archaeon]|nr:bifunctional nuclease family protein [Candidatus Bathyarchaeota archaeon]
MNLRILKIDVFTVQASETLPFPDIGIACYLENGQTFIMTSIPPDIALEILRMMQLSKNTDPRKSISEFLACIPEVETVLKRAIKDIVIDYRDPKKGYYSATITLGNDEKQKQVKVIPSHAILISLISGVNIYVDDKLIQQRDSKPSYVA